MAGGTGSYTLPNNRASTRKNWLFRATMGALIVCAFALVSLPIFFYAPFSVPATSMHPTLLIGDTVLVSRLSYGTGPYSLPAGLDLGRRYFEAFPKRGDVVVFVVDRDRPTYYVKRVVGLPGDEIAMRDGALIINGTPVSKSPIGEFASFDYEGKPMRTPCYLERLPNGAEHLALDSETNGLLDNTPAVKVPPGHYFVMGDNRDNSADSRLKGPNNGIGFVPYERLVGRVDRIALSLGSGGIRPQRIGAKLDTFAARGGICSKL